MNGFRRGKKRSTGKKAGRIRQSVQMFRLLSRLGSLVALGGAILAALFSSGCKLNQPYGETEPSYYEEASLTIDYPNASVSQNDDVLSTPAPLTVADESEIEFSYIDLQYAVHTALQNSRILRDLGGTILRSPGEVTSTYDVALTEMDPRFGVQAALSAFDASFENSTFFENVDKALNNQFLGGGTRQLKQDTAAIQSQISKRLATGTEAKILNYTLYDGNNAPGNRFGSVWETWMDMELRHPLLRGSGVDVNRVAGPNANPGEMNGVIIARLNTDVALTDFEMAVRDFVSNVENAYWDLYFAYRDLDAKIVARDTSLETWNRVRALYEAGRVGGEAEKEAQAREQYFRFQQEVQDALNGRMIDGTQTNNGAPGGSFRTNVGVLTAERRLRLLMGLPVNGMKLLRPQNEPIEAKVVFDWDSILNEALMRRAELRRQKWITRRFEEELRASRNFLLPDFDVVGRYRWRGFGKDFLPNGKDSGRFDNAWEDLFEGRQQEWQVGFEVAVPFGRRQAHVAVDHAEMALARARAVLREQEREVAHQLSNAVAEMERAYAIIETTEDRRLAAAEQLEAVQTAYEADKVAFDVLLESQRRQLEAERAHYQALVEYTLAIRNVHYEKGSLLDYNEIHLTEDSWPLQAYHHAERRRNYTIPTEWLHGIMKSPIPVRQGEYWQNQPASPVYEEQQVPEGEPAETAPDAPPADESGDDAQNSGDREAAGIERIPALLDDVATDSEAAAPIETPALIDAAASEESTIGTNSELIDEVAQPGRLPDEALPAGNAVEPGNGESAAVAPPLLIDEPAAESDAADTEPIAEEPLLLPTDVESVEQP